MAGDPFEGGDCKAGGNVIRLMAQAVDGEQLRAGNADGEAVGMDLGGDDIVAVAGDDHGRRADIAIERRGPGGIDVEVGDIDGVVDEGLGAQHQLRGSVLVVIGRARIGGKDGVGRRIQHRQAGGQGKQAGEQ